MSEQDRKATILNQRGLHARAAAKFVKVAGGFEASVTVKKGSQEVSGVSIMGLMMLAAGPGTEISLSADGPDASPALDAICDLIAEKFGED